MPGLNYYFSKNFLSNSKSRISYAMDNMLNLEHLTNEILIEDGLQSLSCTKYVDYPIEKIENGRFTIYLEGKIYNKRAEIYRTEILSTVESTISREGKNNFDVLFNWLKEIDGDFIVFVFDKTYKHTIFFNDILGRLPFYYFFDEKQTILSRQCRFIFESSQVKNLDKMSLAQSLLFGYTLDNKTIYQKINRFKPGTILTIDLDNNLTNVYEHKLIHNYEVKSNLNIDISKQIQNLTDLFVDACVVRAKSENNVLSLSGGLDSRLVAAGLSKGNSKFSSITLYDPWKDGKEMGQLEVDIAKEISQLCNALCHVIHIQPATGKILSELLNIKDGNNHLGVAYLLNYLHNIKNIYKNDITFFTGDGGDKTVKYQPPVKNLKDNDDLYNYILKIHNIFSIQQVSLMTGISVAELKSAIMEILNSYPETDYNYKYVHFVLNERVNNWLFEGEDRNRFYSWSVTPFYSFPFVDCSMKLDDNLKIRNRLYREILQRINPQILNVKYANIKWPINSWKAKTYSLIKDKYNSLPYSTRNRLRTLLKKEKDISTKHYELINRIKEQLNNCPTMGDFLEIKEVQSIENFSPDQLKMLFNFTSVVEKIYSKETIIEKYFETEFSFR